MADNRMYLRCKVCGESFLLAKNLAEWYSIYTGEHFGEFLDRHEGCFSEGCSSCENRFELVYEYTDGLPEKRWGPELSPEEFIK
jgi:hypothetical protein